MCTIFNSCSMSAHLIWVGYTNLVSNKSETGANAYYNMCTIFNSCSMSAHLIWVGYTNLVSNKSETGANDYRNN